MRPPLGFLDIARSHRRAHVGQLPLLLLSAAVACAPGTQPGGESATPVSPSGTFSTGCGPVELARAPDCAALVAAARREGRVGVVVTLAVEVTPEGQLDEPGRRRQRAAITEAQDALLDDLAPHRARLLTRYTATPQLALSVDPQALRTLLGSHLVAQVQPNVPQPPG